MRIARSDEYSLFYKSKTNHPTSHPGDNGELYLKKLNNTLINKN